MLKYLFLVTFFSIISIICIFSACAKDPFFIQEDHYNHWLLTKTYNQTWLSSNQETGHFTIKIQPYIYSLRLTVSFDKTNHPSPVLVIDVGNFTFELQKNADNLYKAVLEPINTVQFINELKKQKTLSLTLNDQNSYTVSLQGVNEALDAMESFAKDHYIILPQPFSNKLDEFTTMNIPTIVPGRLYPVFRQQESMNIQCRKNKNPHATSCQEYQKLIQLLKVNNICKKETNIPSQFSGITNLPTYQWINCSED